MTPEQLLREAPAEKRDSLFEHMSDASLLALAHDLRGGVDPRWARYRNDQIGRAHV